MTPAELLASRRKPKENKNPNSTPRLRQKIWDCKLREMRLALGLTIYEVGTAIGMSGSGYYEVEHGCETSLSSAMKLSAFFGKSIEDIWSPTP